MPDMPEINDDFMTGFSEGMLHMTYVLTYDCRFLSMKTRAKLIRLIRHSSWPHPTLAKSRADHKNLKVKPHDNQD